MKLSTGYNLPKRAGGGLEAPSGEVNSGQPPQSCRLPWTTRIVGAIDGHVDLLDDFWPMGGGCTSPECPGFCTAVRGSIRVPLLRAACRNHPAPWGFREIGMLTVAACGRSSAWCSAGRFGCELHSKHLSRTNVRVVYGVSLKPAHETPPWLGCPCSQQAESVRGADPYSSRVSEVTIKIPIKAPSTTKAVRNADSRRTPGGRQGPAFTPMGLNRGPLQRFGHIETLRTGRSAHFVLRRVATVRW